MSLQFAPKTPEDVKRYTWVPDVQDDDSLATCNTPTTSGVTVDSFEVNGNAVVFYVSGGTAQTTGSIKLLATSNAGENYAETIYIPILASYDAVQFTTTADDIIDYALRPIVGLSGTRTATETADALEKLNDMVAHWKATGADLPISLPMTTATTLYLPDEHLLALKANLQVTVSEQYGRPVPSLALAIARSGLTTLKNQNLQDHQVKATDYY